MKIYYIFFSLIFLVSTIQAKENDMSNKATFAGGCFWCMQHAFDTMDQAGIIKTTVGYMGGHKEFPTYDEVSSGSTGHAESIQIEYDPSIISYERLLDVFWKNIDPTVKDRQFCDVGNQYRSAIFYHDEDQKNISENSKNKFLTDKIFPNIYTAIVEASIFYPAEQHHQEYYKKHPWRYKFYVYSCERKKILENVWHKKQICPDSERFDGKKFTLSEKKWKKQLTPEEYNILRKKGTEQAYKNEYLNKKELGTYACRACNLSVFSSKTKYDSKTGWPSFWEPICEENIELKDDYSLILGKRIEVVCARCDSHLGHVFDDGPEPTGKRYCINSLALKFISE